MEIIFIATMMETFIIVLLVAIALVASQLLRKKKSRPGITIGENARIITRALVLASEETALFFNQQPVMKLQLQVIPPGGRNFVIEVSEVINKNDLHKFQSGNTIMVRYNPRNIKKVEVIKN